MPLRHLTALLAVTAIFATLAPVVTHAQLINPFGPARGDFTKQDMDLLQAKLRPLLEQGKAGAVAAWRNPANSNFGTMRIAKTFERQGLACRRVTHIVKLRSYKNARRFVVSYCKTSDGAWKIAP